MIAWYTAKFFVLALWWTLKWMGIVSWYALISPYLLIRWLIRYSDRVNGRVPAPVRRV